MTRTPEAAPPIPGFTLGYPEQTPRLPFSNAPASMTEKYRPQRLDDIVGQAYVVEQLREYLAMPFPQAFIFEGPTGVGKTSTALALARELGVSPASDMFHVKSGEQDGWLIEGILDTFRFPPMFGPWRVVIVEEADIATERAKALWLSALEDIPQRTTIIFTTNAAEKLPARFRDRCERFRFMADASVVKPDAQALIDRVWSHETGSTADAPKVDDLEDVTDGDGYLSFRRCVQAVTPKLRVYKPDVKPAATKAAETLSDLTKQPTKAPKPRDDSAKLAKAETALARLADRFVALENRFAIVLEENKRLKAQLKRRG